ncbi:hypothetical protein AAFF_G00183050 [Aldrovandia affinis]|uniref:Uncharacterized protein n=1 Tax=Aldrovandia affinis TaxID=143900 RepID=A0AAD7RKD8_9TELE|nr:hypothetical protein AAFF_G00183050 [Aldrovandia affinis]
MARLRLLARGPRTVRWGEDIRRVIEGPGFQHSASSRGTITPPPHHSSSTTTILSGLAMTPPPPISLSRSVSWETEGPAPSGVPCEAPARGVGGEGGGRGGPMRRGVPAPFITA